MKKIIFTAVVMLLATGMARAAGDAEAGKTKSVSCQACHGTYGNSNNPQWPKLAGQHASYIAKQLADFKAGARKDPTMASMVSSLGEQDMRDLAAYFSAQTVKIGGAGSHWEAGEAIYRGGDSNKGIPACMGCHGPTGAGNPAAGFPALSGQHATYTMKALKDFRSGVRATDQNGMMGDIAAKMSDADIQAVADYLAGLH
jgi:cytochrome c553